MEKITRVLAVQIDIKDGQPNVSVFPYPEYAVYGKYGSISAWVNYYKFAGERYDITIISLLPGVQFDRETALQYARAYASGKLYVTRTELDTHKRTPGRILIASESFQALTGDELNFVPYG